MVLLLYCSICAVLFFANISVVYANSTNNQIIPTTTYNPVLNPIGSDTCIADTILACTNPMTPIQISVNSEQLCNLEQGAYALTQVISNFDCSVVILNDSTFQYIPLPGFETIGVDDKVIITVCDIDNGLNCETVYAILEVGDCEDTNTAPSAQNDTYEMEQGQCILFNPFVNDYDLDQDVLSFENSSFDGLANNGSVTFLDNGEILYTPDPDFAGFDSFMYTITDGNGNSDVAQVTIAILEEDHCNAGFSICRPPFPAPATEVCIDFCIEDVEIIENGLMPLFFDCSLIPISSNCFTYLPLPGLEEETEVVQVEACHPTTGECEIVLIVITNSSNCSDETEPESDSPIFQINPEICNGEGGNAGEGENEDEGGNTGEGENEVVNEEGEEWVVQVDNPQLGVSLFEVYPNPSYGQVFVRINANTDFSQTIQLNTAQTIQVYDLTGKIVFEHFIGNQETNQVIKLNLNDLSKGMYFLELQTTDYTAVQYLILE